MAKKRHHNRERRPSTSSSEDSRSSTADKSGYESDYDIERLSDVLKPTVFEMIQLLEDCENFRMTKKQKKEFVGLKQDVKDLLTLSYDEQLMNLHVKLEEIKEFYFKISNIS